MKSLILIFIALACGLVASIGISQVMDRSGNGGPAMEMEQILVAGTDIDGGAKLDASNLKLEDWPKAKVPEGAIRKLEDAQDKYSVARFYAGEPVLLAKISDDQGGVTEFIPDGYRALPVKVEEDTVMKGISPGDKVDVLVFLRRNGDEIPETGVFPILRNVRVFSINANTERATDNKGSESAFRTVSLLVKEAHVGELVIAASVGKIHLTLRRPNEQDDQAGEEVTPMSEILAGKSRIDAPAADAPPATGFGQMLQQASQGGNAAPAPAAVSEWVMHVSGPDGVKQFDWATRNGMPVESSVLSTSGTASPATTATTTEPTTTPTEPNTNTTTTEPEEPATTPETQSDGPPQVE